MESLNDLLAFLPDFLLKTGIAVVCGGLIGIERERRGKPAGFRTNILICLGATIYMLLSEYIGRRLGTANIDTRIPAQVVTGIGFIGAGTIIQSRGTIVGLTSAAMIWVAAGIGLLIGAGFPVIGVVCTLLVLLTLTLLGRVERILLGACRYIDCEIILVDDGGKTKAEVMQILDEQELNRTSYELLHEEKFFRLRTRYCERHPAHRRFINEIMGLSGAVEMRTREHSNP